MGRGRRGAPAAAPAAPVAAPSPAPPAAPSVELLSAAELLAELAPVGAVADPTSETLPAPPPAEDELPEPPIDPEPLPPALGPAEPAPAPPERPSEVQLDEARRALLDFWWDQDGPPLLPPAPPGARAFALVRVQVVGPGMVHTEGRWHRPGEQFETSDIEADSLGQAVTRL